MNLLEFQSNPAAFRDGLVIPTGTGPRRFGDFMADFQRERFAKVDPSLLAVANHRTPPRPRVWDERTKGASKDTDAGVNVLWLLAFSRRTLRIQVGAYDRDQADELRLIIKGILRATGPVNTFLRQVIGVQTDKIVNRQTEGVCEILTTDKLGSHGARPDVVILDELTHQKDRAFAETLLDNLDKMPCGFAIIATNAGHDPSWQLTWKRTFAESPRWTILEYDRPAPWIDADALAESERRNTAGRYARLWKGQWVADTGDALSPTDVESCVRELDPMTGDEPGWAFVGGLDIGIRKHATGLVVVGKHVGHCEELPAKQPVLSIDQRVRIETGLDELPESEPEQIWQPPTHRLRLAHCKAWKPRPGKRVSLEAVKTAVLDAHRRFNLTGIALDPYQGEHLAELLEREGVPVVLTPQTLTSLQEQATALIEAFQERTIDLFGDEDLLADLKALRVKDTGLRVRLLSPERAEGDGEGTAHGDLASALSFAVHLTRQHLTLTYSAVSAKLITYP